MTTASSRSSHPSITLFVFDSLTLDDRVAADGVSTDGQCADNVWREPLWTGADRPDSGPACRGPWVRRLCVGVCLTLVLGGVAALVGRDTSPDEIRRQLPQEREGSVALKQLLLERAVDQVASP